MSARCSARRSRTETTSARAKRPCPTWRGRFDHRAGAQCHRQSRAKHPPAAIAGGPGPGEFQVRVGLRRATSFQPARYSSRSGVDSSHVGPDGGSRTPRAQTNSFTSSRESSIGSRHARAIGARRNTEPLGRAEHASCRVAKGRRCRSCSRRRCRAGRRPGAPGCSGTCADRGSSEFDRADRTRCCSRERDRGMRRGQGDHAEDLDDGELAAGD